MQDKSPPRARNSTNSLAQSLRWVREQLLPLDPPTLLWGLLAAVVVIKVFQALWGHRSARPSPLAPREEKPQLSPKKDSGSARKQATPSPQSSSPRSGASRRRK